MMVNCFKEIFSQYHLVVSKKLYAAGKEYFKILFWNTYVITLPVPDMCEEPLQAHNQFHLHCLERLVILLQTNWESGKSWRKCERPRSNETASLICLTTSHFLCASSFLTLQMQFSPSTRKRFPHCMTRRKERRRTVEDKPLQVHCSLISSTNRPKHDSSSFYGAPLESELQHTERYLGRLKPIDCCLIWIYTGASKFIPPCYTRLYKKTRNTWIVCAG